MPWDFALLVLLLGVVVPWRSAVRMRQLLRLPATTSQQRLILYAGTMAAQWLLAGFALWRALAHGIAPRALGLALDYPASTLAITVPLCGMMAALQIYGLRRLARLPAGQQGYAGVLARKLMPQNPLEALAFVALAATVAVCEEFLYRGFLLAAFAGAIGAGAAGAGGDTLGAAAQAASGTLILAGALSTLLFALGHLYQGVRGVVSTFVLGLVFCALRIATGSLVPCVAIHFGVDLVAGLAAPRLLSAASGDQDASAQQDPAPPAGQSTAQQKPV
ncbi:MAG TPA: CPBP family intramembrane glutamic endopeptidase [Candidatus Acidoferrum sp.]|nr:CPBP family intramembrane glutamic endopeptidase [Candidatus Acidoferrum sp.]